MKFELIVNNDSQIFFFCDFLSVQPNIVYECRGLNVPKDKILHLEVLKGNCQSKDHGSQMFMPSCSEEMGLLQQILVYILVSSAKCICKIPQI